MAEIQKKIKICPNGHPYDPSRFESCPICSNGGFAPTLDPFAPDSMSATVDPGQQNMGSFAQTAPPDSGYQNQHYMPESYSQFTPTDVPEVRYSGRMQETQSVDPSTPAGTSSPVVGWLVALDGPCRGTDYRIRVGYNYVGRTSGDICIHGDATISAERDCSVTYVPQTRGFYIAHELGKNPLLLNGKPVIREAELKTYDRITVGSTNLIFVALSGEQFDWSES